MKNYDINRNRKPLSEEEIAQGQNFQSFMNAYSARPKPFYKTTTFYLSAAALGIVLAVGGYYWSTSGNSPETKAAYVQAPIPTLNPTDTIYTVDARQEGVYYFETGTQLTIPAGAFLDSAGNAVAGAVELHYREFHDPASIFLAGIPMTYDSAGTKYHFESAGMFELTAFQNGKPLRANPNAPIKIALASNSQEDKFNMYYLDTTERNWKYISRDKAVLIGMRTDSASAQDSSLAGAPIAPRQADKKKPSFSIAFDPNEFPELTAYKGVRFEVDENQTPYNRADAKVDWEDVSIARNNDGKTFSVTFTKGDLKKTYITYAVVDANNWNGAQQTFSERFAAWKKKRDEKNALANQQQKQRENDLATDDEKRIFKNRDALQRSLTMRRANVGNDQENMVMREFVVKEFGIWNSDCKSSLPEGQELFVKLLDSRTKKPIETTHVFLVEKGRNAIFTYSTNDLRTFRFNPKSENLIWAVTADGKIAVAQAEALQRIAPDAKEAEITLDVAATTATTGVQAFAQLGL
ncbi:MAG: hypothetical protein ACRCYO_19770 [Bacteroidia bacterium]